MSYTLHHGDCLDILPTLPAASVDAVVTDPPYGQTNEAYDRGVDLAVWRECYRIAKPGAILLSFAGAPTYHRIACGVEAAEWKVRQMWAWVYRDGLIASAWPKEGFDRLRPAFDPICYATKGKVLLNIQRSGASWRRTERHGKPLSLRGRQSQRLEATGVYPTAIVSDGTPPFEYFVLSRTGKRSTTDHPNEKPYELMYWLLDKLLSGCVVLDPFMGSGTTGEACINTGRDFIGIEKEAQYYDIAAKRLDAAVARMVQLEIAI